MRKTVITTAGLAMSVSLAGIAYAAVPSGPTATEKSSVASATSASTTRTGVDDRGRGRHGADDRIGHDANDDRGRLRHGADDPAGHDANDDRSRPAAHVVTTAAPAMTVTVPASSVTRRGGADDPAGHDATDDRRGQVAKRGSDDPPGHDANDDRRGKHGRHGADDPAGHDAGDDHGHDA